jgi:phage anti-repressor protein
LNKFLSHKAKIVLAGTEAETVETENEVEAVSQEAETKNSIPDVELALDASVEVAMDEPSEKIILIAKKFLIEKRVLTKVIENLGFDYKVLDNTDLLENELASANYDVLFTDKDLVTDSISKSDENLAIITSVNSKEEIEALINTHRG